MRVKLCTLALAAMLPIASHATVATPQLANGLTGWPAPGGTTYYADSGSALQAGGITFTIGGFDNTQYQSLYYVLGDAPGGLFSPAGPSINAGPSGATSPLSYDAGVSNLASGVARWSGALAVDQGGTTNTYDARFTLRITDTSGTPLSLADASLLGLPSSLGGALDVTGDFKANWLYELKSSGGAWTPAGPFYDALANTQPGDQLYTSASGAFYYVANVPVPAAFWLFGSGLLGLTGVARRRNGVAAARA